MSKSIIFTDKDQTFSVDITTEGPSRKLHVARGSNAALSSLKTCNQRGLTVSTQLVQLLQCPVAQNMSPTSWGTLQLLHPAPVPELAAPGRQR